MDSALWLTLALIVVGCGYSTHAARVVKTVANEPYMYVRLLKGVPRDRGIFLGGKQRIFHYNNGNFRNSSLIGVCHGTDSFSCRQSNQYPEDCDNYIRDVNLLPENCTSSSSCKLYFSGNNARKPRSFFCDFNSDQVDNCDFVENYGGNENCLSENIDGESLFQFRRDEDAVSLYKDGILFYGVNQSRLNGLSLIGKTALDADGNPQPANSRVTTRTDSGLKQVSGAHFVGTPFIVGDYAYFLFREKALEYESLSFQQPTDQQPDKIFSRIARVCTNDDGTPVTSVITWTSFQKQRLVCSKSTNDNGFRVDYDEIQDFVWDNTTNSIYAIFTSARNDAAVSAMCVFDFTTIQTTFHSGDFFGTDSANDIWRVNDGSTITPRPGQDCANPNTASTTFMLDYCLMKDDAMSEAMCTVDGDRFTDMEWLTEGVNFTVSSETGKFYTFPADCSSPPEEILVEEFTDMRIFDIAVLPEDSTRLIATTVNGAYIVDLDDPAVTSSLEKNNITVRANTDIEIMFQCSYTPCDPNIYVNASDVIPEYLLQSEYMDTAKYSIHIKILILWETLISFPRNPENNIHITPEYEYTENEITARCNEWETYNTASQSLTADCVNATPLSPGSFAVTLISQDHGDLTVKSCDKCTYSSCDNTCPAP